MDYVKLWTTLHDDTDVKRLSDRAFRAYILAWSWCGRHETDGIYDVFAELVGAKALEELVRREKLIPLDDGEHYAIRGWGKRQITKDEIEKRRAAGKAAADARWTTRRNANRIADGNTEEQVEEQVREERGTVTPSGKPAARSTLVTHDQLYLAERIGSTWHKNLSPAAIQKLNVEFGTEAVLTAMREFHGFPPGEKVREPYAYLRSICQTKVSA